MKYEIDTEKNTITFSLDNGESKTESLYSRKGFEAISDLWVKVGWNEKYVYTFSWMGRPIIQLPEDMLRIQEVIYRTKPDVIIETGVAHGGSLVYYASLCKLNGKGRVIGVDLEIRPHNRKAIEEHELFPYIELIEGNSVADDIVDQVKRQIKPNESVLVLLDSNHSREHVLKELEAYQAFVTLGSYIVATDGVMQDLYDVPRGRTEWKDDNPVEAVADFLEKNSDFVLEVPQIPFNESELRNNITHWPNAWLKRIKVTE
ncbi:cephalosporin hydroxylase family protein [Cohnella mopanensis]|uniref:cephalosporin hydroxylase family protein n=1 Tax=Cohnella mopanensis TaxID=2911966 RepID=UPI001EF8F728|nr:CmcI family methyltransferase [Cohnella mopanensis]